MCLPFNHKWKEHWRVSDQYRYYLGMSKRLLLGRRCESRGKWKPSVEDASPPRKGRVKRKPTEKYVVATPPASFESALRGLSLRRPHAD